MENARIRLRRFGWKEGSPADGIVSREDTTEAYSNRTDSSVKQKCEEGISVEGHPLR